MTTLSLEGKDLFGEIVKLKSDSCSKNREGPRGTGS